MKKTFFYIMVLSLAVLGLAVMGLEYLSFLPNELGGYTTSLAGRSKEQLHNIRLAANALNGVTIGPGETFSFNQALGPYTIAKGYREAPLIMVGKFEKQIAGGICQVSSTLYNAALLADLKIIERIPHQYVTQSVPAGRDATVALSSTYSADLKFKNTYAKPVRIASNLSSDRLVIKFYGKEDREQKVEIEVSGIDSDHVATYRVVRSNGKEIRRELMSRDSYNKGG